MVALEECVPAYYVLVWYASAWVVCSSCGVVWLALQRGGDGGEDVREYRTDEAPLEREATGCGTGGGPPI